MLFAKLIWYQVDILEFTLYLLDHHHVWRSLDLTLDIWWNGLLPPFFLMCLFKKMQLYFAHLSFLYFKKTQLFFTGIFSFASRNPRGSGYLCCYQLNYPNLQLFSYVSGYLVLPSLTVYFIKLSDDSLQSEFIRMFLWRNLLTIRYCM